MYARSLCFFIGQGQDVVRKKVQRSLARVHWRRKSLSEPPSGGLPGPKESTSLAGTGAV